MAEKRCLKLRLTVPALVFLTLIPAAGYAQSGISGVVRDATGGVLPGVSVEASSPALIEKVRSAVTDQQGQYRIVDLRPGEYVVSFNLVGFSAVKREGIQLTTNFTALINAELRVGGIQETVVVSGSSPVVDVQNVVTERVITREVIDTLPTGRTFQSLATLNPGLTSTAVTRPSGQDVGGLGGEGGALRIHGSRAKDLVMQIEGLGFNTHSGTTSASIRFNTGEVEEFSYELGALSAENMGGIRMNIIPKEGGNRFAGTFFANGGNHGLQSNNVTDDLRSRGLGVPNNLIKIWDVNPSLGGPIKKDKLWLFSSFRYWGLQDYVAGMWFDSNPTDYVYTPDLSRQAIDDVWNRSESLRLTWQATKKDKLSFYFLNQGRTIGHWNVSATRSPEAAYIQKNPVNRFFQSSWKSVMSNRLLLEAGVLINRFIICYCPNDKDGGVTPDTISVLEQSTNVLFRAFTTYQQTIQDLDNYRAALSYVTGAHAFKVGFLLQKGARVEPYTADQDINYTTLNGIPRSVTLWATPYQSTEQLNAMLGVFVQDQWTVKHWTLHGGVRFDYQNDSVPEQTAPGGRFVGARTFAAVKDVPNWTDLSPRLGVAYDLFGDGKTAIKASLSRYVGAESVAFARANNPLFSSVNSATRTWNDTNGDFVPQENELGPLSDSNFGKVVIRTRYDDAVRDGFGRRDFNWETTLGMQHELLPRLSVNATYYRRSYGNFLVTDNLLVTPADFDPFCITAPVDPRLPNSGQQLCGFNDVNPAKFGQSNSFVTNAKNFGTQKEVYNGLDFTTNARFPRGAFVQGGINAGHTATNTCFVVDDPTSLRFCDVTPPFQAQVKFLGSLTLPWDVQTSGTFQTIPGPEITASYVATSAQIRGSLGRNLAQGANGTVTVPLISPGTMYGERLYQVDFRFAKIFPIGRARLKGMFDLYNAFNGNAVLNLNTRYGPAWQNPTYILPGRLLKFGGQLDF